MKIFYNAILASFLIQCLSIAAQAKDQTEVDVVVSLENALAVLSCDTSLYVQLQEELNKIEQEFDASAEMRRRMQCCVTYKFDNLNQQFEVREQELLAVIDEQKQTIAELETHYEEFKNEVAAELEALSTMVDILTTELSMYRDVNEIENLDLTVDEILELFAQLQDQYGAMQQERANFLMRLEELADKAYGHFELEAIETNSFGEYICGTLYCPLLDDQVDQQNQCSSDAPSNVVVANPADATVENAFDSYVANWDSLIPA